MKPEIFFLKYAYPCSCIILGRNEITKEEHKLLYKSTKEEKLYLPKERIIEIFRKAMRDLKSISDLKELQQHWWFEHNKLLHKGVYENVDGELRKICMVIPCEVVSVSGNEAIVKSPFLSKQVKVKTDFVDVKPGDKVTKHYNYVSEKISLELYNKIIDSLNNLDN